MRETSFVSESVFVLQVPSGGGVLFPFGGDKDMNERERMLWSVLEPTKIRQCRVMRLYN